MSRGGGVALAPSASAGVRASTGTGFPPDAAAARAALGEVGAPYTYGGATAATGFDSSGLVVWAFAQQGIRVPHFAQALYALRRGVHVSRAALQPGDLVFFDDGGHVGIYVGHGSFVHAPHTGGTVAVERLGEPGSSYTGAIRIQALE